MFLFIKIYHFLIITNVYILNNHSFHMQKQKIITSPLRYIGGKSRLWKHVERLIPDDFNVYVEPMIGGGSMFLRILQTIRDKRPDVTYVLNDVDKNLICFWRVMSTPFVCHQMIEETRKFINENPDDIREIRKSMTDDLVNDRIKDFSDVAKNYFIVNVSAFGGLVYLSQYSHAGYQKIHKQIEKVEKLNKILATSHVTYYSEDVIKIINALETTKLQHFEKPNPFMFLDPPYVLDFKNMNKLYGKKGENHKNFNHEKLRDTLRRCPYRWLMTYNDCEKVREMYDFANVSEFQLKYTGVLKDGKCKTGKELLIYNYDPETKDIIK